MEALRRLTLLDPMEFIVPLMVFAVTMAVGYVLRRILIRALAAYVNRTSSRPVGILRDAVQGPLLIWALILALHLALQSSDLPARFTLWGARILLVLWIFSLTLLGMRIARDLVLSYGAQVPGALPVTTLTQNLAQLAVVILGVLVLLNQLDISITPILTALGVGGLAVALALQDTLSNLFAGFYVAVAGQVRLGDYIKLNTGEEGYVTDISWRSTTIRALGYNLIIVPNAKLAQAVVTNFCLPEMRVAAQVQAAVTHDADLDQVERVLLDVALQATQDVPGMLSEPGPSVAFDPGVSESALTFTVGFHAADFASQSGVRHELRKRILKRLRAEGIAIPFPSRTVFLETPRSAVPVNPED